MSLHDQIQKSMQNALKSRDRDTVRTLRTLLAKLKERHISKGEDLTEAEELKTLQTAAKQRKESIEAYNKGGRQDLAEAESRELSIIESYLPEQMSESELQSIIESVIQETGATSMKDMGKVMPAIMKQVAGKADGKIIQQIVTGKLAGSAGS
ncbi:MAG: GatB/YqeY domain-containing protein [Candidatus Marinimicrobia bacterium]|nr:GatB/YqeY domain-containing protein [Candidatus Neomarinimicrobiota bacterium]